MEYGIQRRRVYLIPPDPDDLMWLFQQFEVPQIYEMFGHDAAARTGIVRAYQRGNLIVGIIRNAETRKRLGFVVVFPPSSFDFWELAYAIPDAKDRDGYSALNASDAALHYIFDHLHIEAVGWRVRADNQASDAIIRRIGYRPSDTAFVDGHNYIFYRLDAEGWRARRERLERGEQSHPSGLGGTFVTLPYPFTPLLAE